MANTRPLTEADLVTIGSKKYPDPFFDLANNYIPRNIKTLFKYCKSFFYTNGFLRNVVTKLTEYPITDILYYGEFDEETRGKFDTVLYSQIKLKKLLIEMGLDYHTMGNVFLSFFQKFKRYLKCPICGEEHLIDSIVFDIKKYEFRIKRCPKCESSDVIAGVIDVPLKTLDALSIVRWAPENIDIEYNPISGSSAYFYSIPNKTKAQILAGNKTLLKDIPYIFLQALKEQKKIEMESNNLYHMKRPTLAEEDMGWGKPLILPALKEIYYLQTLRRGNEAIAQEHIVPKKAVFPANTTTMDPFSMSPDTLVHTNNGIKELQEVDFKNEKLITYDGSETSVVNWKLRELEEWDYMLSLTSFGLYGIDTKVNSVHPFRVWNKETKTHEWKKAKDLTLDDYTAYPVSELPDESDHKELITKEWVTQSWRAGTKKLPKTIEVSNDFLRFLGFYISEGSVNNSTVGFALHAKETEYQEFIKNYLDNLIPKGNETEIYIRENCCDVRKHSVVLENFLINLIGKKCQTKSIRNIKNLLTKENVISLLSGIYDGDGTFFYEKGKYPRLNLKLSNLPLIYELRDILLSLGYYPTICKDDSSVNRAWSLKLNGSQAESLATKLGYKVNNFYPEKTNTDKKYFFDNGFVYSKVKKIEEINDNTLLSIEVKDATHSYLSLGYINKNTQLNIGKWKSQITEQLKKWRRDPNYIGVFPIPIGYQELGGNARALLLTPEMKFIEESIINSLGVPIEFIKGGTTWTGSSISLRIVENHFMVYREQIEDFLNYFVVPKLSSLYKFPEIKLKFKELRMTDDTETKQLAIQLNAGGKISDQTLLDKFGFDPAKETELMQKTYLDSLNMQVKTQTAAAVAQGKASVILAQYQARAQKAQEDELFKIRMELWQDELAVELGGIPEDPLMIIEKYAQQFLSMPVGMAQKEMAQLAKKMPRTHMLVTEKIKDMMMMQAMVEEQIAPTVNAAPNQKKAGTREQDKIKVTGEKQKGPTKGQA